MPQSVNNNELREPMTLCQSRVTLSLLLLLVPHVALAAGLTFGIVGKSVDDGNFVDAWQGCQDEARRFGDECKLLGGHGPAQPRIQAQEIDAALKINQFDALAISVTSSRLIAQTLQGSNMPVFTFDSPFEAKDASISRAYIGTDNLAFGRALAKIAKKLRPQGGTICIITAMHDPNLALRVRGVRQELSGNEEASAEQRLEGAGGWSESKRCPWNSGDDPLHTMTALTITLNKLLPDVILSVGQWPVLDSVSYRKAVQLIQQDLITKKRLVIVGAGKIQPEQAALMRDKLVHGYVSIDFPKMGKLTYKVMKAAAEGKPFAPITYTPDVVAMSH